MAKNWTAAEAAQVLVEGTDTASIRDIGHRFPSFAYLVVKLGSSAMDVFSVIPEAITARKFDSWKRKRRSPRRRASAAVLQRSLSPRMMMMMMMMRMKTMTMTMTMTSPP